MYGLEHLLCSLWLVNGDVSVAKELLQLLFVLAETAWPYSFLYAYTKTN